MSATTSDLVRKAREAYSRGDHRQFVNLLARARAEGDGGAWRVVGHWQLDEEGLKVGRETLICSDVKSAARSFRMAASLGDAEGMGMYGYCLSDGIGVRKNRKMALYWLRRSVRAGCPYQIYNISRVYFELGNWRQELYWLKRSVADDPLDAVELVARVLDHSGARFVRKEWIALLRDIYTTDGYGRAEWARAEAARLIERCRPERRRGKAADVRARNATTISKRGH